MEITPIVLFFALLACILGGICGIIGIILSIYAIIEVKSLQKSTHSVEMMPVDPQWASSDKEITEFNESRKVIDDDEPDLYDGDPEAVDLNSII